MISYVIKSTTKIGKIVTAETTFLSFIQFKRSATSPTVEYYHDDVHVSKTRASERPQIIANLISFSNGPARHSGGETVYVDIRYAIYSFNINTIQAKGVLYA